MSVLEGSVTLRTGAIARHFDHVREIVAGFPGATRNELAQLLGLLSMAVGRLRRQFESEAYPSLYQQSAAGKTADDAINSCSAVVGGSATVNWIRSCPKRDETLATGGRTWGSPVLPMKPHLTRVIVANAGRLPALPRAARRPASVAPEPDGAR